MLYSEQLFEFEIDTQSLTSNFSRLGNYIDEKGIRVDYKVNDDRTTFINMIFEDRMFKNLIKIYELLHVSNFFQNNEKNLDANVMNVLNEIFDSNRSNISNVNQNILSNNNLI